MSFGKLIYISISETVQNFKTKILGYDFVNADFGSDYFANKNNFARSKILIVRK